RGLALFAVRRQRERVWMGNGPPGLVLGGAAREGRVRCVEAADAHGRARRGQRRAKTAVRWAVLPVLCWCFGWVGVRPAADAAWCRWLGPGPAAAGCV